MKNKCDNKIQCLFFGLSNALLSLSFLNRYLLSLNQGHINENKIAVSIAVFNFCNKILFRHNYKQTTRGGLCFRLSNINKSVPTAYKPLVHPVSISHMFAPT